MGKKGSTGGAAGRLGGRLAGGKKLKNRLRKLPVVKVIGKAEKKRKQSAEKTGVTEVAPGQDR